MTLPNFPCAISFASLQETSNISDNQTDNCFFFSGNTCAPYVWGQGSSTFRNSMCATLDGRVTVIMLNGNQYNTVISVFVLGNNYNAVIVDTPV